MYRKQKRIPTLLALLIIFGALGSLIFVDQQYSQRLQAKSAPKPENVHISNVSDSAFTVNWYTDTATVGLIEIAGGGTRLTLFDNEDTDNVKRPRTSHVVTVKNLKEITKYTIKIKGSGICRNESECPTFTQITGTKLGIPPQFPPITGSLKTAEGKPAAGLIVYANVGKSALLSGRTDSAGLWVIPLTQLRSADLTTFITPSQTETIQIVASQSPSAAATAVIDVGSTKKGLTLPVMVIGHSYNFTNLESKAALIANLPAGREGLPGSSVLAGREGLPGSSVLGTAVNPDIEILFPSQGNDITHDMQPRIYGVSIPGGKLTITLDPARQNGSVNVGSDGAWEWRPKRKLNPGVHLLSVSTISKKGKRIYVNRKFTVLKSGERVLGEATASASLSPSPSVTFPATPSATIILTVTAAPPTPTKTPTPTLLPPTLVPTIYPSFTPASEPPKTGSKTPLIALLGTGVALFGLGIKLLLAL